MGQKQWAWSGNGEKNCPHAALCYAVSEFNCFCLKKFTVAVLMQCWITELSVRCVVIDSGAHCYVR